MNCRVHGAKKSQTWLSNFHFQCHKHHFTYIESESHSVISNSFADKSLSSQSYGFSSSHVWMWDLDYKESWAQKNWCFWTVVLEKTLESPLDSKEILPLNRKGNQSWLFIGRTDAEAEAPILWPPDAENWLFGKDPDAEKDWRQKKKGKTEDEMVGWLHRLDGHKFEQAPGVGDRQGSLGYCMQSTGLQRVGHDWVTELNWCVCIYMYVCVYIYIYIYINNPLSCKVRHNRAMITHSLTHTCMCVSIAYTPMNRNIETLEILIIFLIKNIFRAVLDLQKNWEVSRYVCTSYPVSLINSFHYYATFITMNEIMFVYVSIYIIIYDNICKYNIIIILSTKVHNLFKYQ